MRINADFEKAAFEHTVDMAWVDLHAWRAAQNARSTRS